jgi:FlaG protein
MRIENPIDAMSRPATNGAYVALGAPRVRVPDPPDAIVSTRNLDSSSLQFAIESDATTKEIIVKMVDSTTGEVVQQIPAEEVLRTARAITEMMAARQFSEEDK